MLSFNIRHAWGTDDVLDLSRIAKVVRASGADVVGLQEVDAHFGDRSDWADQAHELAQLLNFNYAYGANLDLDPPAPDMPRRQYGCATLSRHPITRWDNTRLFSSEDEEQRGLLHVEISVHGVPLHIYNAHLEAFSETDRARQAEQVVNLIGKAAPSVLLGDFNASPQSPEMKKIRSAFSDTKTVCGSEEILTFPANEPETCIDYIFVGPGVRPVWTSLITEDLVASDHVPVLSELTIGVHGLATRAE
ncbi:endonuclease/exonuclease/phosphatase family protein [Streptomyces sp. NPDC102274]|uniref:endonuclease/exonuclease/phosphatase family protein n=1 Tax=Streptomyces sp. NPDC102274 TaxID=3366151 RepID=UPI00380E16F0